ncbi:zinc-finger homeodomain protein 14-like [Neltuma alba]|uniref:zinc-finger homeodomain protein 14-like n=1 Tax=Neltuma alba TaxID=207710 RepID=UPI0010A520FC|nr:zinc-finger homeodomain protein 14-like [Prosopis alba]
MSGINLNNNIPVMAFKQEVVYLECLHNHAASLGKVATDGCFEFLQRNLDDIVADDQHGGSSEALLCAVCNCHRNFHRKQFVYTPIMTIDTAVTILPQQNHQQPNFPATAVAAADEGNAAGEINNDDNAVALVPPSPTRKRKRRTQFTDEQRSRMASFAERLGWRLKRSNKEEILSFCMEIGVSRRMFVVWVSNNRPKVDEHQTDE